MKMSKTSSSLCYFIAFPVLIGLWDCNSDDSKTGEQVVINGFTNEVLLTQDDTFRYIKSNGIPDHQVGEFPNPNDPIAITAIDLSYQMPLRPTQLNESITTLYYEFGVAINGIPFDPNGPWYIHNNEMLAFRNPFQGVPSGWQYEGLAENVNLGHDDNGAHVQPPGLYHYHGYPTLLASRLLEENATQNTMTLIGYAADGFPLYAKYAYTNAADTGSDLKIMTSSYRLKAGNRPDEPEKPVGPYDGTFVQDYEYVENLGDLDECNGRFGITLEYPDGTYYYVITEDWPYIPRRFKGVPDESFRIAPDPD